MPALPELLYVLAIATLPVIVAELCRRAVAWAQKDRRRQEAETARLDARRQQIQAEIGDRIREDLVQQVARLGRDRDDMQAQLRRCRDETIRQTALIEEQALAVAASLVRIATLQAEVRELRTHLVHCPQFPHGGTS